MPRTGIETKRIDNKKLKFSKNTAKRDDKSISSFACKIFSSLSLITKFGLKLDL
tara:strand:+ start:19 stop:180 length:162 start_codon:yes stop_codon:yes gene_type:complete